jgi:hypothetical protein
LQSIKLSEIRALIAEFFQGFSKSQKLWHECFLTLGEICRAMLDILQEESSKDSIRAIHAIILASQRLFYIEDGHKTILATEFDWHPIWQRTDLWKEAL